MNNNYNGNYVDCDCIHREVCKFKCPMIESIGAVSKVSIESYIDDIEKLCKYCTPIQTQEKKK